MTTTTTTTAPEYTAPDGFTHSHDGLYVGPHVEGEGWHFHTYWDARDGLTVSVTTAPDMPAADVRAMARALDRLDREFCAWTVTGDQWETITTAEPRRLDTATAWQWADTHGVRLTVAVAIWDRLGMLG